MNPPSLPQIGKFYVAQALARSAGVATDRAGRRTVIIRAMIQVLPPGVCIYDLLIPGDRPRTGPSCSIRGSPCSEVYSYLPGARTFMVSCLHAPSGSGEQA
jgi:hypothetical protein